MHRVILDLHVANKENAGKVGTCNYRLLVDEDRQYCQHSITLGPPICCKSIFGYELWRISFVWNKLEDG